MKESLLDSIEIFSNKYILVSQEQENDYRVIIKENGKLILKFAQIQPRDFRYIGFYKGKLIKLKPIEQYIEKGIFRAFRSLIIDYVLTKRSIDNGKFNISN